MYSTDEDHGDSQSLNRPDGGRGASSVGMITDEEDDDDDDEAAAVQGKVRERPQKG